ncbi:MAG: zf-HC2 domain-containing protein [candidate division Zixibacteria bacterium]|nr:zf-HC2 domain-containing protein [candidate division Zixibacteria bacterium]
MAGKCPEYISNLNDYLDGGVSPELCAEIQAHLGECRNCRIMVDTLKQTVKLCRDGVEEQLPQALEEKLTGLLRKHWEKKFGRK